MQKHEQRQENSDVLKQWRRVLSVSCYMEHGLRGLTHQRIYETS